MFNTKKTLQRFASRRPLYCVWIRAKEAADAPLVSIWIDPEMRAFEASAADMPYNPSIAPVVASGLDARTRESDAYESRGGVGGFESLNPPGYLLSARTPSRDRD